MRDEIEVDDGSDDVSNCIPLLQNTASETTSFYRNIFEGRRGGQTPDTPHTDTEKASDGEELVKGLDEAGAEGEDAYDKKICD